MVRVDSHLAALDVVEAGLSAGGHVHIDFKPGQDVAGFPLGHGKSVGLLHDCQLVVKLHSARRDKETT